MSSSRFSLARLALVAVLAALSACAQVLDIPAHPKLVGPWRCLMSPPAPTSPRGGSARVRVQACNFVSTNCAEPVTGLTASLCNKKDVNCAKPIQTAIQDTHGELAFDVPTGGTLGTGFDGYLKVATPQAACTNEMAFGDLAPMLCSLAPTCQPDAPDAGCDIPTFAPALLFFNPPIQADVATPIPLPLIPTAAVPTLTEAAGGNFDPTTGNVFITTLDCDGRPAAGVRLTPMQHQDQITVLYVDSGVISNTATATDASGIGGLLNSPPGFLEVSGSVDDDSAEMPSALIGELGVQVVPFTISYGTIVPAR